MSKTNKFAEGAFIIGRIVLFIGSLGFIAWVIWNMPVYELLQIFILFVLIPMALLTAMGVVSLETIRGLYQISIMGKAAFEKIANEEKQKAAATK